MYTHKTLTYSREWLLEMEELGKQWYRLCVIYDWKIFLEKEEKKQVKSRALTTESNKGIAYLKMQRENIDKWVDLHIPEFIDNVKEWTKFINHYTQKNSDEWKMHAEKQKTFDIRARWNNWEKDKPNITNKANTVG